RACAHGRAAPCGAGTRRKAPADGRELVFGPGCAGRARDRPGLGGCSCASRAADGCGVSGRAGGRRWPRPQLTARAREAPAGAAYGVVLAVLSTAIVFDLAAPDTRWAATC